MTMETYAESPHGQRRYHTVSYLLSRAAAWELLAAMLPLKTVFGIASLVAAPVMYAWLKAEVKMQELI